jgi:hypothetical protein
MMQTVIDTLHSRFVKLVAAARKLDEAEGGRKASLAAQGRGGSQGHKIC